MQLLSTLTLLSIFIFYTSCNKRDCYDTSSGLLSNELMIVDEEILQLLDSLENINADHYEYLKYLLPTCQNYSWEMPDPSFLKISDYYRDKKNMRFASNPEGDYKYVYNNLYDSLIASNNIDIRRRMRLNSEIISAEFLLENIKLAERAYFHLPCELRPSKKEFMAYVLPFNNGNEPIEIGLRNSLFHEYRWVHDVIRDTQSISAGVYHLLDSLNLKLFGGIRFSSGSIPTSYANNMRFGRCGDMVNLVVHILRSLGIPASNDYTPHWGNHHRSGHDWVVFYEEGKQNAIDVFDYTSLNTLYAHESLPKVFRKNSVSQKLVKRTPSIDVTSEYQDTFSSEFVLEKGAKYLNLCVFHMRGQWTPIDQLKTCLNGEGKVTINQLTKNVVYALSYQLENNRIVRPFVLLDGQTMMFPSEDQSHLVDAIITAKYPPFFIRDYLSKRWRKRSIDSTKIKAANMPDLSDTVVLHTFNRFQTTNPIIVSIDNSKEYQYYLYETVSHTAHVAELYPIGTHYEPVFRKKANPSAFVNITDGNPLSFVTSSNEQFIFNLGTPKQISEFLVQIRNSDNNIKAGNSYELFQWGDNRWESHGRVTASDTLVIFKSVPSKGLFWIKNLSGGVEEHVFLLDSLGQQVWSGLTTFSPSLLEQVAQKKPFYSR